MVYYGQFCILSLQYMAAVKVAVEICNTPELKREILCDALADEGCTSPPIMRLQWNEKVKTKASIILSNLNLPINLPEEIMTIVPSVGKRMLNWAKYHENILIFSREYSIYFLKSSFFTQQGIIDDKKAAEGLMNDINLSIEQKYILACIYCFQNRIPTLYKQMKEQRLLFLLTRPQFCKKKLRPIIFWTCYISGQVDKLRGDKTLHHYGLEKALESGCKTAVVYYFKDKNLTGVKDDLVDAAEEAVRNRITSNRDWIIYRHQRYDDYKESWVPSDYYMDILCFLMSKMGEDQLKEFLKKDIEGAKYRDGGASEAQRRSRVLEYFLNSSYQHYFMKTAELMWEFLPEHNYATLLLKICDRIFLQPIMGYWFEDFEKKYYYKGLLKEFWNQSPERFTRYIFSNQHVRYATFNFKYAGKSLNGLLSKLFMLKDKEISGLILARATNEEKENVIRSFDWRVFCEVFLKEGKCEMMEWILLNCFSNKEKANEFKRKCTSETNTFHTCFNFVKNYKWDAAESFIKWCAFSEEEIKQFKKEMMYSVYGRTFFMDLVSKNEDVEVANKICNWCFASEEEVIRFKKVLIYSGFDQWEDLVLKDETSLVDNIISWCLSSQKEIKEFKTSFAYRKGETICEILISDIPKDTTNDDESYIFKGGKWEEVEKFITFCFTSEGEISDFKYNLLNEGSGVKNHFKLIQYNRWEEAEIFFDWLELSFEEVKKLKKETLLDYSEAKKMFFRLMFSKEGDKEFVDYGSKQEAIELLLRWYLTDEKTLQEFNIKFKREYKRQLSKEDVLKDFDFAIAQRLSDLRTEQMVVKRKSETCSQNKELRKLIRR